MPEEARKEYPTLASQVTGTSVSFSRGDEFEYFYFVTNTEMASEKVVVAYEKRGNAGNFIKEAKYDMAVGHLLLQSFWANEAIFQLMMQAYNLFCLFKRAGPKGSSTLHYNHFVGEG